MIDMNFLKRNTKAFVASLLTINIALVLIMLWLITAKASFEFERSVSDPLPVLYSKNFFDDVFYDVNKIAGPGIQLQENSTGIRITINDTLPKANFSGNINTYQNFIVNNFSKNINANISMNFSNFTDGSAEIFFFSKYIYVMNNSLANGVSFSALGNAHNITGYVINITVAKTRSGATQFVLDPAGDINITIRYTDNNGTITQIGALKANVANKFNATYGANESIGVLVGAINGINGAFSLSYSQASPIFSMIADANLLPQNESMHIAYNVQMNYTQARVGKEGLLQK